MAFRVVVEETATALAYLVEADVGALPSVV
jgi:hypothetical protein